LSKRRRWRRRCKSGGHLISHGLYNQIRRVTSECMDAGVPESVQELLNERSRDIGGFRNGFGTARKARTGKCGWELHPDGTPRVWGGALTR
jgi:hypothetical protein